MSGGQAQTKAIFITGVPGIGKTTLIKNIILKLRQEQLLVHGFFTEEVRQQGSRVGFEAVLASSLEVSKSADDRATLAHVETDSRSVGTSNPRVGKYVVDVGSFEKLMFKSLHHQQNQTKSIVIIDEIGKMELFSQKFKDEVLNIFKDPSSILLATIPVKSNQFVDYLRNRYKPQLFTVNYNNRNQLCEKVVQAIVKLNC